MADYLIVTRHPALVQYLAELGLCSPNADVIPHATLEDVRGRHVIGVLPMRLAAATASITEIPLDLPPDQRGVELTVDQVRQYAAARRSYIVLSESDVHRAREHMVQDGMGVPLPLDRYHDTD